MSVWRPCVKMKWVTAIGGHKQKKKQKKAAVSLHGDVRVSGPHLAASLDDLLGSRVRRVVLLRVGVVLAHGHGGQRARKLLGGVGLLLGRLLCLC